MFPASLVGFCAVRVCGTPFFLVFYLCVRCGYFFFLLFVLQSRVSIVRYSSRYYHLPGVANLAFPLHISIYTACHDRGHILTEPLERNSCYLTAYDGLQQTVILLAFVVFVFCISVLFNDVVLLGRLVYSWSAFYAVSLFTVYQLIPARTG